MNHSPVKHARAVVTVYSSAHERMVSSEGNDGRVSEWKAFQELRSPGGAMFALVVPAHSKHLNISAYHTHNATAVTSQGTDICAILCSTM